jgi:catechol 2,3-dioxygenase-like lactoylglutathione lyase family enzyme
MSPKMTHICIHVSDLDDCARFYKDYCKLEIIRHPAKNGEGSIYMAEPGRNNDLVIQLKSGGADLELLDDDERHFGFAVDSRQAVDEIASKAKKENILFFEADEYLPGAYLCGVKDPNGNCVEFGYGHTMPPD